MVSIGEPLAVLNRDGLITHPYLRQCDAYPRPSSTRHFGSRKNKQNNRRACLRQGGYGQLFSAATSGAKRPQRQALARASPRKLDPEERGRSGLLSRRRSGLGVVVQNGM